MEVEVGQWIIVWVEMMEFAVKDRAGVDGVEEAECLCPEGLHRGEGARDQAAAGCHQCAGWCGDTVSK